LQRQLRQAQLAGEFRPILEDGEIIDMPLDWFNEEVEAQ